MANKNTELTDLETFEEILCERAGGGPSAANYDPDLLVNGMSLINEVRVLRAALEEYATPGSWAHGNSGTCYPGRAVAAKALGRE